MRHRTNLAGQVFAARDSAGQVSRQNDIDSAIRHCACAIIGLLAGSME
jgi:hypothetical protein